MAAPRRLACSLAALALLLAADRALAQVDGQIIGTVTDAATGVPLAGVVIQVEGTSVGNLTAEDGTYFLNRVPAGVQRVTAEFLGYTTQERRLRVYAGHTATVDFDLAGTPVEAEGVVAVIQREPLLVRDRTTTKTHFTAEDAVELPLETIDELVALSAGVYQGQGGFIIRGGRGSESATYVDGVLTSDFTTQRDLTEIGTFAIEQVDVVTGGFSAEYGYAQSGLINIVTRSGGTEFHGNVRFTTDGRFGTDGLDFTERHAFETESCCGYNSLQLALGGPLVDDRLTLFGSFEATGAADFTPRAAGFNPLLGELNSTGSTQSILPGNQGDRTRFQLKAAAYLPTIGDVEGTVLFSRDQSRTFSSLFGLDQHLGRATRTTARDAILSWTRPLFRSSDRDMTFRLRAHHHWSESHSGIPQSPEAAAVLGTYLGPACGAECNVNEDAFGGGFLNYRIGKVEFFFEDSFPGTVHNLRLPRSAAPDPVFGVAGIFRDDGFSPAFSHAEESRNTVRADLDAQIDRYNRLKIGTEWTWIDLDRREGLLHNFVAADLYHVDPMVGAAYVQHRWDDGDLVIDLGLRWDYWNPRTMFPELLGVVPCDIAALQFHCTAGAPTVPGKTRHAFAPRLGVAHPLTDRAQVRLSFGRFHQLPELGHYFRSYRIDTDQFRGLLYGNPELDYIQTTGIELGLTWLVANETAIDFVGYLRDREGAIRAEWFQPGTFHPDLPEMRIFVNGDHGNVKGFDITLIHQPVHNFYTADLTWSLQWARGTTSSPLEWVEGFGALHDPLQPGRLLLPPNALSPESYDRLHNIDGRVVLKVPDGFAAGSFLEDVVRNVRGAFIFTARSGTPYTRTDAQTRFPAGSPNGARNPWTYDANIRVVKAIPLGALTLDAFLIVNNVFGHANVLRVHPTTGAPDLDGLEEVTAANPVIRREFLEPGAVPLFPLNVSDILPQYRAAMERQDLDGNGFITLDEAQVSTYRAIIGSGSDTPFSYGGPRIARFGLELRF